MPDLTKAQTLHLPDEAATIDLGARLAPQLKSGDIVYLRGGLGMGKSSLARAMIRTLTSSDQDVPSPTFTLMQTYDTADFQIAHLDLYRLKAPEESYELGLDDALAYSVLLIEWPERLGHLGFDDRLDIILEEADRDQGRKVTITPHGRFRNIMPDFNVSDRESLKQRFLSDAGFADAMRQPLPGDASTRRYERLVRADGQSFMLMDQPPVPGAEPCRPGESESERRTSGYFALARLSGGRIEAFVAVADYLRTQGLSAPDIIAVDSGNGLLISEDLGADVFVTLIDQGQDAAPLYLAAIEVQAKLHAVTPPDVLPGGWPLLAYDDLALKTGAEVFTEWYPHYDPACTLDTTALAEWEALWAPLRQRAEAGATVFIHRDFHAENLLWLPEREGIQRVGLIDFQDALRAHPSWDLLSLLQDARRDVSPELEALCLDHYFKLRPQVDRAAFMRDYTALATLNAARILGVFARLVTRDHKPKYAAFMPRMLGHLSRNLRADGMEGLRDWFGRYGFNDRLIS